MNGFWRQLLVISMLAFALVLAGCGGDGDEDNQLVKLDIKNLGRLSGQFNYGAWVRVDGRTQLLTLFNTDADNNASFFRFSLIGTLQTGDEVFVTIEPESDLEPNEPSNTLVLTGTISGNTANLSFPRLEEFANAEGFVTVTENGRQIFAEYSDLPDLSDINFIYQGFLLRNGVFTPLQKFTFNQVPISDTVNFDATTARYILSVEPVPDFAPNQPYTIRPFFTNGNLVPLIRQRLVRSSLTPGQPSFNFPSGTATVQ